MSPPVPPEGRDDAPATRGRLIVISGPSGAGKTSVAAHLLRDPRFGRTRTATARPPRGDERDGVDYDFLSEDAFRERLARGEFLEHAVVYGNLYGTPRANLDAELATGRHCLLVVDVQGARTLRDLGVEAYYVFVEAPDADELRRRLEGRGRDAPERIAERLATAERERAEADWFDLVLVNVDVAETACRLAAGAGVEWAPAKE